MQINFNSETHNLVIKYTTKVIESLFVLVNILLDLSK